MRASALVLLLLLGAIAGCIQPQPQETPPPSDDERNEETPDDACVPPEVEPTGQTGGQGGVSNEPGAFSYGGQMAAKTAKEVFLWENPSPSALIAWGGQSASGSVKLTIQDACGVEVYTRTVSAPQQGGAQENAQEGEPGDWVLTFEFTLYTGQMGLSITSS